MRTPVSMAVLGRGGRGAEIVRTFETLRSCELRWVYEDAPATSSAAGFRRVALLEDVLHDETLDAVAIAAPPSARGDLVRRALGAGKHVLVEPPFTLEGGDADDLARLAADGNLRLVTSSFLRFYPAAARLKELIASGRLGELYYLSASRLQLARTPDDESVLWGPGADAISMLLWLVGDEPVEVVAHGGPCGDRDAADVAFCHLRFATGIEAELRVSRLEPQPTMRVTAVGSKGMGVFDELEVHLPLSIHEIARVADGGATAGDVVAPRLPPAAPLRELCEHFLAVVSAPGLASDTGRSGAAVVAVVEALQRSLERGGTREAIGAEDVPTAGVVRLPLRSV